MPGAAWYPGGDPIYLQAMQAFAPLEESVLVAAADSVSGTHPADRVVRIDPALIWQPLAARALPPAAGRLCSPAALLETARESFAFLAALETAGIAPAVTPYRIGRQNLSLPLGEEAYLNSHAGHSGCTTSPQRLVCLPPPAFPYDLFSDRNVMKIARFDFDGHVLPATWVAACRSLEALWLPTAFHRDACLAAGLDSARLHVVPAPLLPALYDPTPDPLPLPGAHGFVFLACAELTESGGLDLLVTAFVQEFTALEAVCLVLKPLAAIPLSPERLTRTITEWVQRGLPDGTARMPTLVLHTDPLPAENRPNLLSAANAYVTAQRGSRTHRWLPEAMAMGLPTIGPAWGSAGELLREGRGIEVPVQCAPVPPMSVRECPPLAGQHWAEVEILALRRALRQMFAEGDAAKSRGIAAQTWVRTQLTPQAVADRINIAMGPHASRDMAVDLIVG